MIIQAGVVSKWTNDSQHFLLGHFDTIHNSPSHIYHSALPLSPSSSWIQKYYNAELSPMVKIVKGLPAKWGLCSCTVLLDSCTPTLSYWNNTIAIGSECGDIIILNVITGSQITILSGHTREVSCVVFSSDGTSLVSGSHDGTVKLWDVQTGGDVRTFSGHSSLVWSVSISADQTTIASGSSDNKIYLWDIHTGEHHCIIKQENTVKHVHFSPTDPQHLISVCNDQVYQWNTNGYQIKPPYDGSHVTFSQYGTQLVLCNGAIITVQNSNSGATVVEFYMANSYINHCCFSPDGGLVAAAAGNTAYVWDITGSDPHLVETFIGHTSKITSLVFSSSSSLISASCDKSIRFWQIGTSTVDLAMANPGSAPVTSPLIWSVNLQGDPIAISGDVDGVVKTWDISSGLCKASFQTPAKGYEHGDVQLVDGRLIIAWCAAGRIYIWDVENGRLLLKTDKPEYSIEDLRISGDGSKIIRLNPNSIEAWDIWTGIAVGRVEFGYNRPEFSVVDHSRVWVCFSQIQPRGWDFGIPNSPPVDLENMPPDRPHPGGNKLWDTSLSRIKDVATGKVVFQLPARLGSPVNVQWNDKYLAAHFKSKEVLVLAFHPAFLQ